MSPLSSLKVRKDDERLAHGVVKTRTIELFDPVSRSKASRKIMSTRSASAFIEVVKDIYGEKLVDLIAGKLTGSRSKVDAIVAEPMSDGGYGLAVLIWRGNIKGNVRARGLNLVVSPHAVARAVQRTVGYGDVDKAVAAIFKPILAWARGGDHPDHDRAKRIIIRGFGGELRCEVGPHGLLVKTWIDAGSLPEWKRESAMAEKYTEEIFF